MKKIRGIRNIGLSLICSGLLLTMPTYGQDTTIQVNLSDQTLNGEGKIYKVKTDGTERQVLTTIGAQFLVIDDEAVFFCSQGNSDNLAAGLYAISNEGKDLRILDEGNVSYLNIDGDGLYYLMDKDTIKESTHRYNNIQMIGDKIFYQEEGDDGLVFRQKHLWKNQSKIIGKLD